MNCMSNKNITSQVKEYIILFANKLIVNALYIVNNLLKTAIILFVVYFIHISDNNDYRFYMLVYT